MWIFESDIDVDNLIYILIFEIGIDVDINIE